MSYKFSASYQSQNSRYIYQNSQTNQSNISPQKSDDNMFNDDQSNPSNILLSCQNTLNSSKMTNKFSDENSKKDMQYIRQQNKIEKYEEEQQQQQQQQQAHISEISQQQNNTNDKKIQEIKDVKQNEHDQYHNYQSQSDFHSINFLIKSKIYLPDLQMGSYINSVVQQLRQIYYINKTIFGSSSFGQQFEDLFVYLENGNKYSASQMIERIFQGMATQQQKYLKEGDVYMCICNILNQIKKSLPDNEKEKFDNNFLLKYSDQLECYICQEKIQNIRDLYTFHQYEQYGQECNQLKQAFSNEGDQNFFQITNPEIICEKCRNKSFFTKREYQVAPNFMIIRLLNHFDQPIIYINNLEEQFELQGQKSPQKYQIIGFCYLDQKHYQYFAKYDSKWIDLNESQAYPYYTLNLSKVLYFALKKIQNNTAGSKKESSELQSQQSPNLIQADVIQDRYFEEKISQQTNRNSQIKQDIFYQQNEQEKINSDQIKNKQIDIFNENSQKIIEQQHNGQFQNIYEQKLKGFVNACKILCYLEDKKYIIPVFQTLIQIYYFFDQDLFGPFANQNDNFQSLLLFMKEQDTQNFKLFLKEYFMNIKQNKKYYQSQEAYSYFCDLLFEVMVNMDILNSTEQNNFENNFLIKYRDQFQCQQCNEINIQNEDILTFYSQDIFYNTLSDDISSDNDQTNNYLYQKCYKCKLGYQNLKRIYVETPNFLLINKSSQELNEHLSKKINNEFKFKLNDRQYQSYKIIGFCSYYDQEYSYTAKCEHLWVEIKKQKEQVLKPNCSPNCSNAQYFVLQKQIQN